MDQQIELRIVDVVDNQVVWIGIYLDDKLYFKEPLAAAFRRFFEPQLAEDVASGETAKGFQPTVAFAKLRLGLAIESEMLRA